MNNMNVETVAIVAERLTKEAAKMIKSSFVNKELIVEFKSNPNDLVTEMDKKIELFFQEEIEKEFPNHSILGEEGAGKDVNVLEGIVWIIDPIDGTTNFVHQQRHFAISIGIYENGIGQIGIIYDVMADELFLAKRGQGAFLNKEKLPMLSEASVKEMLVAINPGWLITEAVLREMVQDCRGARCIGAAALEMASVAANRMDAYISLRLSPWDYAAGAIILEEVGAKITTITGEKLDIRSQSSVFVAKKSLYEELKDHYLINISKGK